MGIGVISKTLPLLTFTVLNFYSQTATDSAQIKQADTVKRQEAYYLVQEGDTMLSIAEKVYGSPRYWTILWNDNEWIEDPSSVELGAKLSVRTKQQTEIEKLKPELAQKTKGISYASRAKVVLTANTKTFSVHRRATGSLNEAQINFLGNCESGMRPTTNTGNGFYGAFQFTIGTWNSMNTGYTRADLAPLEVQKDAVQRLLARSSIFSQFPACARKLQNAGLLTV